MMAYGRYIEQLRKLAGIVAIAAVLLSACAEPAHRGIGVINTDPAEGKETKTFKGQYAVSKLIAVGINEYRHADRLRYAVNDARGIAELFGAVGFETIEVYDQDATRDHVMNLLQSEFLNAGENDRIIFFFAGHGIDLMDSDGANKGYLVPVNGSLKFPDSLIPMDWMQVDLIASKAAGAKHILYILDACSSGIIATRSLIQVDDSLKSYVSELLKRRARQVITAGTANQQVLDGGYRGHSIFTGLILKGLGDNLADMNKDYHVTATELGIYLSQEVFIQSSGAQKPDFAKLMGTEGGEVVLKFPSEAEQTILDQRDDTLQADSGSLLLRVTPKKFEASIFRMDDSLVVTRTGHDGILSVTNLPSGDYKILVRTNDGEHASVKILLGLYEHVEREVSLPKKLHRIRIPTTI